MGIRKKLVNGQEYYYLEESIRLEKPKVYSIFLGKRVPEKSVLEKKKEELLDKIYSDLLKGSARIYLKREELIEAEKRRRRHVQKMKKLGKFRQDEKDEIDTINFVYTTLSTEGVPVTKQDAELAYRFGQRDAKNLRDENLRVALDMVKGLRFVKESKPGISREFILKLHGMVMAEYSGKNPGTFRRKQAYIYLKSYEQVEEISFRPPAPSEIGKKLDELVLWYNENRSKLNALELAAILHLKFYAIHPFDDGNKRVSRLLMNKALFDCGYPLLNISKNPQPYFDALVRSVESKDERHFVQFVYKFFVETI
jgi:Fic family protein